MAGQKQPFTRKIYVVGAVILGVILLWMAINQIKATNAPPTVKIGLVAPFEGLYRQTGYEVLFAVKLALQERNQGEGLNGYRVELVALNDFNDTQEAHRQAQALAADPHVMGVIGHLTAETTLAALPVYQQANLAVVIPWSADAAIFSSNLPGVVSVAATVDETAARLDEVSEALGFYQLQPVVDVTLPLANDALYLKTDAVTAANIILSLDMPRPLFGQVEVGNRQLVQVAGPAANGLIFVSPAPGANEINGRETFKKTYQALAGFPPGPRAIMAYDATNILLDSIEQAMITSNQRWRSKPNRPKISATLIIVQRQGLSGNIKFGSNGQRLNAPVWVYQISEAKYPGTAVVP